MLPRMCVTSESPRHPVHVMGLRSQSHRACMGAAHSDNGGGAGQGGSDGGACTSGVSACDTAGECVCLPPKKARAYAPVSSLGWWEDKVRKCHSASTARTHARTHTRARTHAHTHTHAHVYVYGTWMHVFPHTNAHIHTQVGMGLLQGRRVRQEDALMVCHGSKRKRTRETASERARVSERQREREGGGGERGTLSSRTHQPPPLTPHTHTAGHADASVPAAHSRGLPGRPECCKLPQR